MTSSLADVNEYEGEDIMSVQVGRSGMFVVMMDDSTSSLKLKRMNRQSVTI